MHIIDWFPTLAKMAAATFQGDGVDLSPVLFKNESLPERDLYWTWKSPVNRWALSHGDWKIVHYGKGTPKTPSTWQLFNLKSDPKERLNLAADHPAKLTELHQRFLKQRAKDAEIKK
jgi:arylsulfatase A-like enzyme